MALANISFVTLSFIAFHSTKVTALSTIVGIPLLSIPKSARQTGNPNDLLNAAISFLFSISPAH